MAVVVTVSAISVQLTFGKAGIISNLGAKHEPGRLSTGGDRVWLAYQKGFPLASVVRQGTDILPAWAATQSAAFDPALLPFGILLGYGLSVTSLIFLQFGFSPLVTHHTTLPARVAAVGITVAGAPQVVAMLIGAVVGILGALLVELFSGLFLINGDTHVDPPATTIIVMSLIGVFGALLFAKSRGVSGAAPENQDSEGENQWLKAHT